MAQTANPDSDSYVNLEESLNHTNPRVADNVIYLPLVAR